MDEANNKFDKKSKSVIAVYLIILLVYIIGFIIIPFQKNAVNVISFVFTVIAMISSFFISSYAFKESKTILSKIYGYPIFRVGVLYAIVQFLLGLLFCVIDIFIAVPYWIILILSIILLGATAVGVIITDNTRDVVEAIEESAKINTENMSEFQRDIARILGMCEGLNVKPELEKLNEQFNYSDPVTNKETEEIENNIKQLIFELELLVREEKSDEIITQVKKLSNVLSDRNRACKKGKG